MSKTTDTLRELADEVDTREDLVRFIVRLREDFVEHPEDWENRDLETYLEGMAAWVEDCDGYYSNIGQDLSQVPSYRLFAHILLASAIYE